MRDGSKTRSVSTALFNVVVLSVERVGDKIEEGVNVNVEALPYSELEYKSDFEERERSYIYVSFETLG